MRLHTIASSLRELRKKYGITPHATDQPEEMIELRPRYFVNSTVWGVRTVECWCKRSRRNVKAEELWQDGIYILDEGDTSIDVRFDYFLDGTQRTTPIGNIYLRLNSFQSIPVHLGQIGVVLLKREHRKLIRELECQKLLFEVAGDFAKSVGTRPELKDDILEQVDRWLGDTITPVDTSFRIKRLEKNEKGNYAESELVSLDGIKYPRLPDDELWNWCSDPSKFRSQARRWTTRYRDLAEQDMYDKALALCEKSVRVGEEYGFVVKDGPLTHVRGGLEKSALGVIKSFGTIFLDQHKMDKVLALIEGYRSPVVTLRRPQGNPEEEDLTKMKSRGHNLLTWYVKIRERGRHDPTWGLLRLELHADAIPCGGHSGRWSEIDSLIIDEISRKILEERAPTSAPDPRWHNLLYPIHCCEEFLKARAVPHLTAKHLVGEY